MAETGAREDRQVPGNGSPAFLQIRSVTKRFGGFTAVDGVSLDIKAGEFFALLGPSGCGKTTLLRTMAGFEGPDDGAIVLDGEDITGIPPHQRPINMMFQSYALFPHLSVGANVAFGLKRLGLPKADVDDYVAEMLALVQLGGMQKRKPDQLSGGQRQRVALARALARRPKILLLDEPMAALDKKLRGTMQRELMALQRRLGMTFVIVTHDQEEAMTMADRIGVMDAGRLEQVGTPRELYETPASRWIAEFVGDINLLEGQATVRDDQRVRVTTRNAGDIVAAQPRKALSSAAASVAIRPEKVRLSRRAPAAAETAMISINTAPGQVIDFDYLGSTTVYRIQLDAGATLRVVVANSTRIEMGAYAAGERVFAWFAADDAIVLEP